MGRASFAPGASVQAGYAGLHARPARRSAIVGASPALKLGSQPLDAILGCAPAPGAGGLACVPCPAATNARKRPTVTSYTSSSKLLTVAGYVPSLLRLNVPPGTGLEAQQSWLPPHVGAAAPQLACASGVSASRPPSSAVAPSPPRASVSEGSPSRVPGPPSSPLPGEASGSLLHAPTTSDAATPRAATRTVATSCAALFIRTPRLMV